MARILSMNKKEREELLNEVSKTIIKVVNGKIDRLTDKFEAHEKEFVVFREEMRPVVDLMRGSLVARKVILWFTSTIIALASAYLAVKGIFK